MKVPVSSIAKYTYRLIKRELLNTFISIGLIALINIGICPTTNHQPNQLPYKFMFNSKRFKEMVNKTRLGKIQKILDSKNMEVDNSNKPFN
jgi:hypothetical protein